MTSRRSVGLVSNPSPGYYVKLHSGTGTNGKYNLHWQRAYGAVWNNTPPERAYLLNQYGTLVSSWSPY